MSKENEDNETKKTDRNKAEQDKKEENQKADVEKNDSTVITQEEVKPENNKKMLDPDKNPTQERVVVTQHKRTPGIRKVQFKSTPDIIVEKEIAEPENSFLPQIEKVPDKTSNTEDKAKPKKSEDKVDPDKEPADETVTQYKKTPDITPVPSKSFTGIQNIEKLEVEAAETEKTSYNKKAVKENSPSLNAAQNIKALEVKETQFTKASFHNVAVNKTTQNLETLEIGITPIERASENKTVLKENIPSINAAQDVEALEVRAAQIKSVPDQKIARNENELNNRSDLNKNAAENRENNNIIAQNFKTPEVRTVQNMKVPNDIKTQNNRVIEIRAAETETPAGAKAAGEPDVERTGAADRNPSKKGAGDPDSKKGRKVTFEEAVELTGHGRFNHLVLTACGLVLLYTYSESLGMGFMVPAAQPELQLTTGQKGLINASTFIGIVMTAIMWGYLSDNYGRRKVMLPAMFCNVVFSLASSLFRGFYSLFLLRVLTGCFVSASSATVFAYLGECTGNEHRARYMAFGATFIAGSLIELPLLAWIVIAPNFSFSIGDFQAKCWHIYMWSWVLPGIVAIAILLRLPESPRFVYAAYGPKRALRVLKKMYALNHDGRKDYPVTEIDVGKNPPSRERGLWVAAYNLTNMFQYPLRKCVVITHTIMFMAFMLASGMYTWMPEMLNEVLFRLREFKSVCKIVTEKYGHETCPEKKERPLNAFLYPVTILMGVISLIVYMMIGMFVNKFGRLPIFKILIYSGTAMLLASSMFPVPAIAILLYITGMIVGISPSVLAAIAVEVFPTSVRALALCTLYMMGRLGAAVGTSILGYGLPKNCELVFTSFAIAVTGSALLFDIWPDPAEVRRIMEERGFAY